jgi:hypothetical protein
VNLTQSKSDHLSPVWFKVTELKVASASGTVVTTRDGTEYPDLTAGVEG